jgi:hypothetical protein
MIDDTALGRAASSASHCASNGSGRVSPEAGQETAHRGLVFAVAHGFRVGHPEVDLQRPIA